MRIIIATHSELALGFKKTIEFFFPQTDNIDYVCAYVDEVRLEDKIKQILMKYSEEKFVMLTDIKGGSVTQVATQFIFDFDIKIIAGVNLPLIFQLLTINEPLDDSILEQIIKTSREEIVCINDLLIGKEGKDD